MKDIKDLMGFVIVFGLIVVIFLFSFLFVKNIFSEEILPRTITEVKKLDLPADTYDYIDQQQTNFDNFDFNVNMIFIMIFVMSIIITTVIAWFLPSLPSWNFLSILFIGSFAILFVMNFIIQIYDWFVQEFIYNVFSASDTNIPALLFYTENQALIVFTWLVWILVINQLSNILSRKTDDIDSVVVEE